MAQKFTITAELNLQTKNLTQVVNNLRQQFQGANLNVKITNLAQAQAKMQSLGKTTQSTQKNINSLGNSLTAAVKKFSVVTLATGTLIGLTRAVKNAVGEAIQFEREIIKISQATGQSVSQLSNLKREINSVSSAFGVSSKELVLAARELTQAGFAADKVAGSLKVLAQTELAATFDSIADTTEGAIAVLNQFGKEAQRTGREVEFLEKSFSAINQVSKEFAVESSDLVTAVRTTGAAFESAGGSLNELLALFTSVRSTTRESAESISTGFRTIFTRTQRLDTINNLRALGVELQDVEGKFIGPMEAVKRLSTALNSIDPRDFRFNLIVEELGGFRQVSKVIPLIQQFAVTQRALNVAQSSSGSLAKDAATAQQSLAIQIQKTREEFLRFIRDLTETSSFKSFATALLSIANAFIKVGDTLKPLLPLVATFAAFKLGTTLLPGLKSIGAIKRNSGGPVHHFAGGGMVPGSGNGDTVPAMLTPGEFVIRKSSVQKLGADNLARANKYAGGGAVQFYKDAGSVKKNDKSKQNTVVPQPQDLDSLTFTNTPSSIGGLPSKTKVLNSQGVDLGPANDSFKVTVNRKIVKISKSDAESYGIALAGGKGSGGIGFEKYLNDKFGYELLNEDRQFPFDVKTSSMYGDAKDLPTSAVPSLAGYKKALNFLMFKSLPGYQYKSVNKQTLQIKDKKAALAFGSGNLTTGKDEIKFPTEVDLLFPKKLNRGGLIQKFALGGPAGKSRGARAITIPRTGTYTFDKPAGADLDSKSAHDQIYKLNAEDRLDYDIDRRDIDVNNLKVSQKLLDEYHKADAQKRGYRFEDILMESGLASSLSKVSNARLDGVTKDGNPFEAKSTLTALGVNDLEDKLYGAIADSISAPEKLARSRFNANALTEGEDHIKVGKVTVFQDVTGGLGAAKQSRGRMGYEEEAAAKAAKEAGTRASLNAQDRLKHIVDTHFNSGFKIAGTQYSPIGPKGVHRDVAALLNKELGGPYQDKIGDMTDSQVISALNRVIVRRANGGTIAGLTEIPWMAKGGATGTDTVPAMLTPGEFVINRKSAQAIGYSALDRMNKVGKYANGGPVQHFASGGPSTPIEKRFLAQTGYTGGAAGPLAASQKSFEQELIRASKQLAIMQRAGVDTAQVYKDLTAQVKTQGQAFKLSAAQIKEFAEKTRAAKAAAKQPKDEDAPKLSNNMLLLGTAITSVVSQMNMFEKETADMISAAAGTFTVFKGVGDNLLEVGQKLNGGKFASAFKIASAGVTGYAVAQAGLAARLSSFSNEVEKEGKKFTSAVEALRQGVGTTQNQLYESLNKQLQAAEVIKKSTSRGSQVATGTAGIVGALVGGALGGQVGATIGSTISTAIVGYLTSQTSDKEQREVQKQSLALSEAMFSAVNSTREFNKFLEKGDKATPEEVAKQSRAIADAYKYQQERLSQFTPEVLKNASEQTVQAFNAVSDAAKVTAQSLEQIIGREQLAATKKSGDLVNLGFVPDVKALAKPGLDLIKEQVQGKYQGRINQATGEEKQILTSQMNAEIVVEQEKYTRELTRSAQQQIRMAQTLKLEQAVRKKLIGTMQQENALAALIEGIGSKLEKVGDTVSNVEAAFSDSLTGFKSKFNSKVFDLKFPNQNELNQALDPVRKLGPIGENLAKSILDINKVTPNLRARLLEMAQAGQAFDVAKFVKDAFDIDVSGPVGEALVKLIENTIKPTEGTNATGAQSMSLRTEEARERIAKAFENFGAEFKEKAKGLIQNLEEADRQQNEILQKINESRNKQLELALQGVDAYSKYIEAVGKARGRDLSLLEKNNMRAMKQYALVGNLGGNINAIGQELLDARKKLNARGLDNEARANLSMGANRLETALKQLADQSDKTADTLNEIEKIRQQRENYKDYTTKYTFGTGKERESMGRAAAELQKAMAAGTTDVIPENFRQDVLGLLQQFKDLRAFNGMTGNEVINRFNANNLMQQGNVAGAQMMLANSSPPEERLIGSLRGIFMEQIKAQAFLAKQEGLKQEMLNEALNQNKDATRDLISKLDELIKAMSLKEVKPELPSAALPKQNEEAIDFLGLNQNKPKQNMIPEQGGFKANQNNPFQQKVFPNAMPEGAAAKLDLENIQQTNEVLDGFKQAIDTSDQKIYEFTARLENLVKVMENNRERFKEEEAKKKAKENPPAAMAFGQPPKTSNGNNAFVPFMRAEGGLIYRAGGGSIFQPKGTDTVPAMLTPGEFVIKKSSVDKIGTDALESINAGHYASGGLVGYLQSGGSPDVKNLGETIKKLEDKVKALETKVAEQQKTISILQKGMTLNQTTQNIQSMSGMFDQMMGMDQMQGQGQAFGRPVMKSRLKARENAQKRAFNAIAKEEGLGPETIVKEPEAPPAVLNMGGTRQQVKARERAAERNFKNNFVGPPEPNAANGTKATPVGIQPIPENFVGPLSPQQTREQAALASINKQKTLDDQRANEGEYLRSKAIDADRARSEGRSNALLNPVGPPVPKGMRPANSIYSEAQWTQMQEKAAKEKELSDLRVARMKEEMVRGTQVKTDKGYREATPQEVMAKYGERPAHISEEQWVTQIRKAQEQGNTDFFKGIAKQSIAASKKEGNIGDYASGPQSTYTEKTQEALDKAKAINQQADELTARRSGKAVGTNYKSLEDVPVLTAEQVGAPVSLKQLKEMQNKGTGPAINRSDLTIAEKNANKVAENQPNQYEPVNAMSDYLNFMGKEMGNQAIANRVRRNQTISGIGTVGSRDTILKTDQGAAAKNELLNSELTRHPILGFASGGSTDTIPAMLTPGEFVMNKSAVGKYGTGFMNQLNRGGTVQGFARGGQVGYYAGGGGVSGGGGDLAVKIDQFTKTFQDLASQLNGLTVTHTVRVDGQLNIGGIDGNAIATQIRDGIANYVIDKINATKENSAKNTNPNGPSK